MSVSPSLPRLFNFLIPLFLMTCFSFCNSNSLAPSLSLSVSLLLSLSLSLSPSLSLLFCSSLPLILSLSLSLSLSPSLSLSSFLFLSLPNSLSLSLSLSYTYHNPASTSICLAWAGDRDSCGITIAMGFSSDSKAAFNFIASLPIKSVCRTLYGGRLNVVVPYLQKKIISEKLRQLFSLINMMCCIEINNVDKR